MKYVMMDMPNRIKVAVPIDEDETVEELLLLILRDQAWSIINTFFYDEF